MWLCVCGGGGGPAPETRLSWSIASSAVPSGIQVAVMLGARTRVLAKDSGQHLGTHRAFGHQNLLLNIGRV